MAADQPVAKYYIGEAITTSENGVVKHPYIVTRTEDKAAAKITEYVVSYQTSAFQENTSEINIDEKSHFTLKEAGAMTGSGDLTGTPWAWTFLRAILHFKSPNFEMTIDDFNFFAEPNTITAHKDFYRGDRIDSRNLLMQEDLVLYLSNKAAFEAKRDQLLKK